MPQNIAAGQPDAKASGDLVTNSQNAEDAAKALQLPPADVLVAPFQAEVNNKAPVIPSFIAFYAPAVLALLLQHVSITLTALTLVRERTSGATELFRVTPSATPEIVFGKFIAYALVAAMTGAILAALLRFALHVPLLGSYAEFVAVIALLIAAALGLGLVISAIARTETQAVQYAMLILLASVFFGNFFLPIDTLYPVGARHFLRAADHLRRQSAATDHAARHRVRPAQSDRARLLRGRLFPPRHPALPARGTAGSKAVASPLPAVPGAGATGILRR